MNIMKFIDQGYSKSYAASELAWRQNTSGILEVKPRDNGNHWGLVCGIWLNETAANRICEQILRNNGALGYTFSTVMVDE